MSYTVVDDDACLQVRATISTRAELEELIAKLTVRLQAGTAQEENHEHDTAAAEPVRPSVPTIFDSAGR